ncbi:MAG: hypothetical protein ACO3JG_12075 [Luteolibacter sp.]
MWRYLKLTNKKWIRRSAIFCVTFLGVMTAYSGLYYVRIWRGVSFGFADHFVLYITRPAEGLRRWYFVDLPFQRRFTGDWLTDSGGQLHITKEGTIAFKIAEYESEVAAKIVGISPWAGYQPIGLEGQFEHDGELHNIKVFIQEDDLSTQRDEVVVSRTVSRVVKGVPREYWVAVYSSHLQKNTR